MGVCIYMTYKKSISLIQTYMYGGAYGILLLLLLLLLITAIEFSLGGSSLYTSVNKINKNKYI